MKHTARELQTAISVLQGALDNLSRISLAVKTPGQVAHEAAQDYEASRADHIWRDWDALDCKDTYEASAAAVLDEFGQVETALARMDAVPAEELGRAYWNGAGAVNHEEACNRVRARLILAAIGKFPRSEESDEEPDNSELESGSELASWLNLSQSEDDE